LKQNGIIRDIIRFGNKD